MQKKEEMIELKVMKMNKMKLIEKLMKILKIEMIVGQKEKDKEIYNNYKEIIKLLWLKEEEYIISYFFSLLNKWNMKENI